MTAPLWMDAATLARNLCICVETVDAWTKQGLLPPPFDRGGKRLWKWETVEAYLEGTHKEAPQSPGQQAREITDATRRAVQTSEDRYRYVRERGSVFRLERKVSEPR